MEQLIRYLQENLMLDFQGDLSLDQVRDFLRQDNSEDARTLLNKLNSEGNVNDMMIVLADCLQEFIPQVVTSDVLREQIRMYSES